MSKIKTYSCVWSNTILPGAVATNQASINNFNREFKILSLTWEQRMRLEAAPMSNLPIEQNTTQEMAVELISQPVGNMIAYAVANPTPLVNMNTNGTQISIYSPGQFKFQSFFIQSRLLTLYNHINRDALNTIRYYCSLIIEIEEL